MKRLRLAPQKSWRWLALVAAAVMLTSPALAAPPDNTRDELICRAASSVGFSYYWGGSCWCRNGCSPNFSCWAGSCSGNCPSCTHSGSYGADCSGLVNKVWQVPNAIATTTCGHGPYVASSFRSNHTYWNVISRSNVQAADVLASTTHVVVYHYGDPWGNMVTYEARGCSSGIVHNWRTCSSSYSAARRINIVSGCDCTPGKTETGGCGNCGTHTRTCQSDCHWGSWSSCTGQGPCAAGTVQTTDCCDCGSQSRSCSSQCEWGGWSACAGPDPAGDTPCQTDLFGPCAEGTVRCQQGCLACDPNVDPEPELCDEVDNDCNGTVDDGLPAELGTPPPAYAAQLVDGSYPAHLSPGETAQAWAAFRNVGTAVWPADGVWLVPARQPDQDGPSPLYDEDSWPAWDVAAVLDREVAPGEEGTLEWTVRAPNEQGVQIAEELWLVLPGEDAIHCPEPVIQLAIDIGRGAPEEVRIDADEAEAGGALPLRGSCSCRTAAPSGRLPSALWLGLLLIGLRRRRRPLRRPPRSAASS